MRDLVDDDHLRRIEHDLRHEVGTIGVLASLISNSADVGEQSRQRSRQLLVELTWLDRLVDSMVTDGRSEPTQETAVHELFAAVIETVNATSPVRMTVSLEPVTALIHRVDLWRVLRNLLLNAVEASGPSGLVEAGVRSEDDHVVVSIRDTGAGFHADDAAVSRRRGLKIVRDTLRAAGGSFEIRNEPAGGCTVTVRLPSAERPQGEEA